MSLKARLVDYLNIACEDCKSATDTEFLGIYGGTYKFKTTCRDCEKEKVWKASFENWDMYPGGLYEELREVGPDLSTDDLVERAIKEYVERHK